MSRTQREDMTPEEFRTWGREVVDWIADYLAHPERYPVLSPLAPGDVAAAVGRTWDGEAADFSEILKDFERTVVPGLTHWNHPSFLAYFASSASGPGVLGDFLSSALNQQAMLWRTSPAATELEAVTLSWLGQLIGLPNSFGGVIYDTASISTLHALAAARERALPHVGRDGLSGRGPVRVYCSEQAHSSVDKSMMVLGLGRDSLTKISCDAEFRMRPDRLRAAIDADRRRGVTPIAVVATVGTTSTTSVDPVPAIADICQEQGSSVWLHVDAAYAGVAAMVPGWEWTLAGCANADSVVVNPHKWLFTPFDLSAFYCRHMDVLRSAFSLVPDFLQTTDPPDARSLMDTGIQLGRRFRALKLWMVLRYFGRDGLVSILEEHMRLARLFASWVDGHGSFERVAPVPFSIVCFRANPPRLAGDELALKQLNQNLLDAVNKSGRAFLSHTRLGERFVLRLAIGNVRTRQCHVEAVWSQLRDELERTISQGTQPPS